jgi:hypothetical protein
MEARALGDLILQPSQPLLRILNFRNTRISVFPEVEEFLVMLFGFVNENRIIISV